MGRARAPRAEPGRCGAVGGSCKGAADPWALPGRPSHPSATPQPPLGPPSGASQSRGCPPAWRLARSALPQCLQCPYPLRPPPGRAPFWRGLSYLSVRNEAPRGTARHRAASLKPGCQMKTAEEEKAKCGLGEASSARPWGGRVGRQLFSSVAPSLLSGSARGSGTLAALSGPSRRGDLCKRSRAFERTGKAF